MLSVHSIRDEFPLIKHHLNTLTQCFLPDATRDDLVLRLEALNRILSTVHMPKLRLVLAQLTVKDVQKRPALLALRDESEALLQTSLELGERAHEDALKTVAAQLDTFIPRMRRLLAEEELYLLPAILGRMGAGERRDLEEGLRRLPA